MSDKLPSPWSAEFYEANTVKKLGGEIQQGFISDTAAKAESLIATKKANKALTTDQEQEITELSVKLIDRDMTDGQILTTGLLFLSKRSRYEKADSQLKLAWADALVKKVHEKQKEADDRRQAKYAEDKKKQEAGKPKAHTSAKPNQRMLNEEAAAKAADKKKKDQLSGARAGGSIRGMTK